MLAALKAGWALLTSRAVLAAVGFAAVFLIWQVQGARLALAHAQRDGAIAQHATAQVKIATLLTLNREMHADIQRQNAAIDQLRLAASNARSRAERALQSADTETRRRAAIEAQTDAGFVEMNQWLQAYDWP